MYRRKSQITNFGVQKLTINVTVTNKAHFYAGHLLFVMREWRIGSAVVVSAIHDASDFDGESPLRIVSTDRFAGMHLHRGILVRYQSNGY